MGSRGSASPAAVISSVAGDVLWDSTAALAVFDPNCRLFFSNPAWRSSRDLEALLDRRQVLADRQVAEGRLEALRLAAPVSLRPAAAPELRLEWQPLREPGWSVLVAWNQSRSGAAAPEARLAEVVHEISRPLMLAQSALDELVQLCARSAPAVRAALSREGRALGQLSQLLASLRDLDLSGLDPAATEPVDIGQLVAQLADMYAPLAAGRGYQLTCSTDGPFHTVWASYELLSRAVGNLVDNALKYSVAPGPVRIQACQRGALAVIEVGDAGPGIPVEQQERVFGEFVRLPSAQHLSGSGLGLAVARRVAAAYGGGLSLESQVGLGSTFRVSFVAGRPAAQVPRRR